MEELEWLYNDALFLKENDRKKGCICLVLCLIDALAKKHFPNENGNKKRYCDYLEIKLRPFNMDRRIRVEERDELVHIGEMIYKYFRCYFVHEGDDRRNPENEIYIDYENEYDFMGNALITVDRVNEKLVFNCNRFIEMLFAIVETELEV